MARSEELEVIPSSDSRSEKDDGFCRGPYFDYDLSWNTTNPNLTQCFMDTTLIGIPSIAFWILSTVWIGYQYHANKKRSSKDDTIIRARKKWSALFLFKAFFTFLLAFYSIAELGWRIRNLEELFPSDLFHPICLLIASLTSFILLFVDKIWFSTPASPPQFVFYLLLVVGTVPSFKVQVEELLAQEDKSWVDIACASTLFPVTIILLFLNCFADLDRPLNEGDPLEGNCSFLSTLFYGWLDSFVFKGFNNTITFANLIPPPEKLLVNHSARAFLSQWNAQSKGTTKNSSVGKTREEMRRGTSIWPVLLREYGLWYLCACILITIKCTLSYIGPQILKLLVNHVDSDEETWKGFLYVSAIFISQLLGTLCWARALHEMNNMSLQMRSNVLSLIYRKALHLSNNSRNKYTVGEVTNYMAVDAQRIVTTFPFAHNIWSAPFSIILALIFLYLELGVAIFAGIAALLIIVPINVVGGQLVKKWEATKLEAKDKRIKLMNEIIAGMKVLKLYAWEIPFMQRIIKIRDVEIKMIKNAAYYYGALTSSFTITPVIVSLLSFGTYVAIDPTNNVLTADKVFVCISLMNIIRLPLLMFPYALIETLKLVLSLKRIEKFLNAEELKQENVMEYNSNNNSSNSIEIRKAYYTWEDDQDTPTIKDVSFDVKKGSLVAVVGAVGSGKSSLLSAMLGEMNHISGTITIEGKVAYVPQQPWIQNMTLKDNIIFCKPLDADKYGKVIESCALSDDLTILTNADKTEIGENGINLSGGQKQRVSMARAVYSDADIYLLDDPLSAVDAHVGKHIFEHVLGHSGMLRGKTRILVTHGIAHLPHVDNIIVIKNNTVSEQGTYQELIEKKGAFADFIKEHMMNLKEDEAKENDKGGMTELGKYIGSEMDNFKAKLEMQFTRQESQPRQETNSLDKNDERSTNVGGTSDNAGKLVVEEEAEIGEVKWMHFKRYFKNVGLINCLILLCLYSVGQFLRAGGQYVLSKMSDTNEASGENSDPLYFFGLYFAFGAAESISELYREISSYRFGARASDRIHKSLLHRILRGPMRFFDTNPTGRILNRFSSDVDVLDGNIPNGMNDCVWCTFDVMAILIVITSATPMFITVLIPIGVLYILVTRLYMKTGRQVKRIESICKSPIYAHFSESITGAVSIRAYRQQERFISESQNKVQTNLNCSYLSLSCNRWLTVRLEVLGNFVIVFSSIFAILARDELSAGVAGLSISYAFNIILSLNWMIIQYANLEMDAVSLERIMEYMDGPEEAEWDLPSVDSQLPKGWPCTGDICFDSYQARYRDELDLVLNHMNMNIKDGEKIGICGRTGAGKSSLTLALFRIIEPAGGRITIDGIDISTLGLHTLRSHLTIIPQDPVLFTGELRFNLDPTGECTDEALWKALEMSHLKNHVAQLPEGLDHEISEGGANFSMGQRQLICLTRALLRKTKILILDEATASVDLDTDAMIQTTIRDSFDDCTVLTIAHRLKTILDSSRIAVLSEGKLEEMGTPDDLLSDPYSAFSSLVHKADAE